MNDLITKLEELAPSWGEEIIRATIWLNSVGLAVTAILAIAMLLITRHLWRRSDQQICVGEPELFIACALVAVVATIGVIAFFSELVQALIAPKSIILSHLKGLI